jgi:hypothetical protein
MVQCGPNIEGQKFKGTAAHRLPLGKIIARFAPIDRDQITRAGTVYMVSTKTLERF